MMVALLMGMASLVKNATMACPDSWYAVISLFFWSISTLLLSGPGGGGGGVIKRAPFKM